MQPAPATSPSDARRDAVRGRILDAALGLFAEVGYHGTTIPAVLARAGVGASSLYRVFDGKEALVNAVFRDAKGRLHRALYASAADVAAPRDRFDGFWASLCDFARREPVAFRFLEMQDHVPYLDGESRQLELAVLAPIYLACLDFRRQGVFRPDVEPDTVMAFIWGAFVGLMKAERLGYVRLPPAALDAARDACWRAFAAEAGPGAPPAEAPSRPKERSTRWTQRRR